ncbi:MAG: TraR/DksA family transcriptional regulator [Sporichthyaceae bacterium]
MIEDPLPALEAEWVRARERADALRRDLELMVESVDGGADDEHDPEGTTAFERAQTRALFLAAEAMLTEIEHARARVTAGTYGICEGCAAPILTARLEARPIARTCVSCAASHPH